MKHFVRTEDIDGVTMLSFYNDFFERIRSVTIDDKAWFVAKDVAYNLGFADTKKAIRYHVEPENRVELNSTLGKKFPRIPDAIGRKQRTIWIDESGVNAMILGRNNMKNKHLGVDGTGPTIKEFKQWVTGEIMPSIRRYGKFGVVNENELAMSVEHMSKSLAEYQSKRSIDHDGFMHLIVIPGGTYEQFLKYRYVKTALQEIGIAYERF